jgi:hypothetical protein
MINELFEFDFFFVDVHFENLKCEIVKWRNGCETKEKEACITN